MSYPVWLALDAVTRLRSNIEAKKLGTVDNSKYGVTSQKFITISGSHKMSLFVQLRVRLLVVVYLSAGSVDLLH